MSACILKPIRQRGEAHFSRTLLFMRQLHKVSLEKIGLCTYSSRLQVGDRLFSAFGQDTIDSLFWTAAESHARRKRAAAPLLLFHFALACAYVLAHATLVLLQATTINVAINASNKALFTIMMSNNVRGVNFWPEEKNFPYMGEKGLLEDFLRLQKTLSCMTKDSLFQLGKFPPKAIIFHSYFSEATTSTFVPSPGNDGNAFCK